MKYGKLVNGKIKHPNNNELKRGEKHEQGQEYYLVEELGYKLIDGSMPMYDEATQRLEVVGFVEEGNMIRTEYRVVDKEEKELPDDQRFIKDMRKAIKFLSRFLSEEEMAQCAFLFDGYDEEKEYKPGDKIRKDGELYEVTEDFVKEKKHNKGKDKKDKKDPFEKAKPIKKPNKK
jgi:hypothetical protein